jgi:predicted transglutaminase-like cysteine proteinase
MVRTNEGDCKAIALGKYFTLRQLGWPADDLRVVMNWDDQVLDWHAVLAARLDGETYVLDSILGLQRPRNFRSAYMVYSISEAGIWDHAPDFVPVQ